MTTKSKSTKPHNYLGPLFLITLGVVFLLQTTGYFSWRIWSQIWKFWPMILILQGLQNLLGNSKRAQLITILVTSFTLIFVLLSTSIFYQITHLDYIKRLDRKIFSAPTSTSLQTNSYTITASDYPNADITQRQLNLDLNVGQLNLTTNSHLNLFQLQSNLNQPQAATLDHQLLDNQLIINFNANRFRPNSLNKSQHHISLGKPEIPTNINLNLGAGSARIDLSNLNLNDLKIHIGLGSASISFSPEATISGQLNLDVGLGSLDLQIPASIAYQLNYDIGLGSIQTPESELNGNGTYTSPNQSTSSQTLKIHAHVGLGSINISNH